MRKTLLIHGPLINSNLDEILTKYNQAKNIFDEIVFVVYSKEKVKYLEYINAKWKNVNNKTFVFIDDLINPGFANINRQIHSVRSGLKIINNDNFVVKLRNDQSVDFNKLFNILSKYGINIRTTNKIITTCSFTRKDRLYHPSDMFLCGKTKHLHEYYSLPIRKESQVETEMLIRFLHKESGYTLKYSPISPESELFREYLKLKKWDIKETYSDYINSLIKYFFILNAWDIDYCWSKKRLYPFKKENLLILPHYYTIEPFEGAPIEKVSCLTRADLHGHKTIKDCYYIAKSRIIWKFWPANRNNFLIFKNKYLIKYKSLKVIKAILSFFPYFLIHKKLEKLNTSITKAKGKYKNAK